jgi:hypothetical protein
MGALEVGVASVRKVRVLLPLLIPSDPGMESSEADVSDRWGKLRRR